MNCALLQYTGWYDDDNIGGMEKTLTSMMNADPNFGTTKKLKIIASFNFDSQS